MLAAGAMRGERRAGPYLRLECRLPSGPKVAVYLGPEGPLVAAARDRLDELQRPLRERRQLTKALRHLRRGARAARVNLAQELSKIGLRLKGSEVRGFAHAKLTLLGERQEVIYPWIELSLKGSKCKDGGASYLRLASEGRVMEDSVKCYESLLRQGANRLQG